MYFLWSEVLMDFTVQDSYTFDSHYTLLFKAICMSFKNIYNFHVKTWPYIYTLWKYREI